MLPDYFDLAQPFADGAFKINRQQVFLPSVSGAGKPAAALS
jgi:hypothetical protein